MNSYFKLAKNVSRLSDHRIAVGAVIIKKKPIIAVSNLNKSHPTSHYHKSLHAEIRAIINCNKEDLTDAIMYVYREFHDGSPALARPCNTCYSYMKEHGIK